MRTIFAADLYCGAGGSTAGMARACHRLGYELDVLAVNHWSVAISTHSANQPWARHICWPVDQVDPRRVVESGHLDLLWASPECTHHSIARGGMPVSDQKRAGAWQVPAWATALCIDALVIENVKEFVQWGPLTEKRDHRGKVAYGKNGRPLMVPDPQRKGETFKAWLKALESLGYNLEWKVLNCADYGAPTARHRFFLMAKRGKGKIEWPAQSHGVGPGLLPHRTAREIIDWGIRGESIFNRKRPLAENTLRRIAAGLQKFGGPAAEPFLVMLYGTNNARSVDRAAPTVTANGQHIGRCEPFLLPHRHAGFNTTNHPRSLDLPLNTVNCCSSDIALIQPFILPPEGIHRGNAPRSVDDPVQTITAGRGGGHLVQPFMVAMEHGGRVLDIDKPVPTITCAKGGAMAVVSPFVINYNGKGRPHSVEEPLDTVTTRDRFGLVQPYQLDILFRMLQPHELAAAQGFDAGYKFFGSKEDQVRQIGNAVPPDMAEALTEAQVA